MTINMRCDIFERVCFPDNYADVFEIIKSELIPNVTTTLTDGNVVVKGQLELTIKYRSGLGSVVSNRHTVPVEIAIPRNRVVDVQRIAAEIESFEVELLGQRTMNLMGVMVVKERMESMSEKVKLPREVAEAIENLKQHSDYPIRVAMDIIYREDCAGDQIAIKEYCESDRSRRIGYIASALVNGWEVEMSKEERVAEYITRLRNMRDHSSAPANQQRELNIEISGALQVLEYLDIKIEEVNT